jgi:hypothetical protein
VPNEAHPVPERPPGKSEEQRIWHLEQIVAQLWDQVWWLSLSPERRAGYQREGFTDPITVWYGRT